MGKAPADQFYWNDWLSDVELQSACSATRGIWMNALCRMWFSQTRGELTGTRETLPRILNCTEQEFDRFCDEAQSLSFCYFSVTDNKNVTLRNRRMFREAKDKELNRLRQQRHRDKHKSNGDVTPPSSSSSSFKSTSYSYVPKNGNCPHDEIISLYHEILPEMPRVKDWTPERQKLLRKRWRDDAERQDLEWWRKFFQYVRTCPFLMGDKTEFQADLEWIIRPRNFVKIREGKYQERK